MELSLGTVIIISGILTCITFGYLLAWYFDRPPEEVDPKEKQYIRNQFMNTQPAFKRKVGAILTPTQEQLIRKENPKLAETEEAMRQVFKDLKVEEE